MPDNFRFPNARPGGVIDLFSRTGLYIVGFKVHYMSVAQAEKFYGPVLDVLQDKFREPSAKRARLAIEEERRRDRGADVERSEAIGDVFTSIFEGLTMLCDPRILRRRERLVEVLFGGREEAERLLGEGDLRKRARRRGELLRLPELRERLFIAPRFAQFLPLNDEFIGRFCRLFGLSKRIYGE